MIIVQPINDAHVITALARESESAADQIWHDLHIRFSHLIRFTIASRSLRSPSANPFNSVIAQNSLAQAQHVGAREHDIGKKVNGITIAKLWHIASFLTERSLACRGLGEFSLRH